MIIIVSNTTDIEGINKKHKRKLIIIAIDSTINIMGQANRDLTVKTRIYSSNIAHKYLCLLNTIMCIIQGQKEASLLTNSNHSSNLMPK